LSVTEAPEHQLLLNVLCVS